MEPSVSSAGSTPTKKKISVYVAHAMTGKMQDELVKEAEFTTRMLTNYGFEVLDPIVAEGVKSVHEPLTQVSQEELAKHWKRDKEMIREADIVLDFHGMNKSDGVSKELGYARFCLWKPVVRVFPNMGINISRIEDDIIVDHLIDAVHLINEKFGDYEKLRMWRQALWDRCFDSWLAEQNRMNERYGVKATGVGPMCIITNE